MKFSLAIYMMLGASTLATAPISSPVPTRTDSVIIKMYDQDGIDKWAECSWKTVPVSTENWLKAVDKSLVSVKPSKNPMASPKTVLGLRLNEACGQLLSPSDRSSINYSVERAKFDTLKRLRPSQIPSNEAKSNVLVCEISAQGKLLVTVLTSAGKEPESRPGIKTRCLGTLNDGSLK